MTGPASVVLDAQGAQNRAHFDRGIPRYVVEHLRAVLEQAPEVVDSVLLNPARPLSGNLQWLLGRDLIRWAEGQARAAAPPPIFHIMSPFELDRGLEELWPHWARARDVRTVVTLYDLIPLVFEDHYLRDDAMRTRYLARAQLVRSADLVLAISQATADDAVRLLGVDPARVAVVGAGVSAAFAQMFDDDAAARRVLATRLAGIRPGFALYVSGIEFRKNNERLIEAYGALDPGVRARHQLVLACRMRDVDRDRLSALASAAGVRPGELLMPGYVTDAELAALYRLCRLFVFPSLYEGSGLPILEAMACGAPVIASRTSTTPEIFGDREGTFDPLAPADIARCLERALGDDEQLGRLRARSADRVTGYTWPQVAERTLAAYAQAPTGGATLRRRRSRPRIAWVSPWPPVQSGVATYSHRLVGELAAGADVDVFVGGEPDAHTAPRQAGVRLLAAGDLDWALELRAYDALVHSMGNSAFHEHVHEALLRRRGVVIAHDVRLVNYYGWYAAKERPRDPAGRLAERLHHAYGERIHARDFADHHPTPDEQTALGLFLSGEMQAYADRVVVHSAFAREVLLLDRPPAGRGGAAVSVLPLAIPQHAPSGAPREEELIVSFGVLSEVKGLATLIDAVTLLPPGRCGTQLVLAGPGDPAEIERWRRHAADRGVAERVTVTGFLEETAYDSLLDRATVAVQLRTVTQGEASAAVGDCLAAGVPTVATALGWVLELPPGAVELVPAGATPAALASLLDELLGDPGRRQRLAGAGVRHAESVSFPAVARRYLEELGLPFVLRGDGARS